MSSAFGSDGIRVTKGPQLLYLSAAATCMDRTTVAAISELFPHRNIGCKYPMRLAAVPREVAVHLRPTSVSSPTVSCGPERVHGILCSQAGR